MAIKWRIIGNLTDKTVLGTDGLSNKEPKRKSRAILVNNEGKYAVIFETKSNRYTLPGGGIEVKEDEITAIKREVLEETGCMCDTIEPLGLVLENRSPVFALVAGTVHRTVPLLWVRFPFVRILIAKKIFSAV